MRGLESRVVKEASLVSSLHVFQWHPPTLPSHPSLYPAPLLHPPSSCSCPLSDPPTVGSVQSGNCTTLLQNSLLSSLPSEECLMTATVAPERCRWNYKRDTIHSESVCFFRVQVGIEVSSLHFNSSFFFFRRRHNACSSDCAPVSFFSFFFCLFVCTLASFLPCHGMPWPWLCARCHLQKISS